MKKKSIALILVLALVLTFATGCSQKAEVSQTQSGQAAQTESGNKIDYPTKPITINVGFSAGGSSDVMVRLTASVLEKYLGQPVVVVNKPGAAGFIVWEEMAKSVKPDGYTFALINTPHIILGAYDPVNPRSVTIDDFDILCNQVTDYNVICIRNDETRFSDLPSLIEYAKKNTVLTASSAVGIVSDDATIVEYFNMNEGTDFQIIQTGGAKDNETMFLAKDSDILVGNIGDVLTAYKNGTYKVIAVFAPERVDLIKDVPTAKELGYDFYMFSARGYALPKGVDPAIKEKLLDALKKAINDPQVKDKLAEMGAVTDYKEGQEYYDFLIDNMELSKKIYGIQ